MSDLLRRCAAGVAIVGIAGLAAGCISRPVGDFGRADPSFTHDVAMPFVGDALTRARGEAVSNFNQSDQEKEMHNRVWRFLTASHANDWFYDVAVELQRTRLTPATDTRFAVDRYYQWLKRADYQSSTTRYATVGRHIAADLDTLPTTFQSICAVEEIDRQRAIAYAGLSGVEAEVGTEVAARQTENNVHIDWFVRALTYRYQSYDYGLDHLLVETPHEQSLAVDEALRHLSAFVERAQRRDFCGGASVTANGGGVAIPSRYGSRNYGVETINLK